MRTDRRARRPWNLPKFVMTENKKRSGRLMPAACEYMLAASSLAVDLRAAINEFAGLVCHPMLQSFIVGYA